MTTRQRLAWAPLLLSLTACRDQQNREAEFRLKEECYASGTKFFHEFVERAGAELTATFYSPKRNSCICETRRPSILPVSGRNDVTYDLYDCLSVERLGEISVPGSSYSDAYQRGMNERKRQKDALK
jgi:hypothetical protein